jgi:hypothetical protein
MMKNELVNVTVKNEVVTVNETKTKVSNASKTNKTDIVATIDDLKKVFAKCGILAKYTDNSHYVGCGTKCNSFSVNLLKTQYNVYCNDTNFDIVNSAKLTDVKCIKNANSSDKTRPNTITVKTTKSLETVLKLVLANDSKIALVK